MINFVDSQNDFTEWKNFAKVINNNPTSRPIILESWKRCSNFGLDPASFKLKFLPDTELKQKILNNEKLIKGTKVLMDYFNTWNRLLPFYNEIINNENENIIIISHGDTLSIFNAI